MGMSWRPAALGQGRPAPATRTLRVRGRVALRSSSPGSGPRGRRRTLMATKFPLPRTEDGQRVGIVALDVTAHRQRDASCGSRSIFSPVPMARLSVEKAASPAHPRDANEALRGPEGVRRPACGDRPARHLHPESATSPGPRTCPRGEGARGSREVRVVRADGSTSLGRGHDSPWFKVGRTARPSRPRSPPMSPTGGQRTDLTYQARHDALTGLPEPCLVERLEPPCRDCGGPRPMSPSSSATSMGSRISTHAESPGGGRGVDQRGRTSAPVRSGRRTPWPGSVATSSWSSRKMSPPQEAVALGERLCASLRAPVPWRDALSGLESVGGRGDDHRPRASSEDLFAGGSADVPEPGRWPEPRRGLRRHPEAAALARGWNRGRSSVRRSTTDRSTWSTSRSWP